MFEKLKFLFQSQKKVVGLMVLLLIAAAVPLTVFIAQQQQTIQQKAAEKTAEISTENLTERSGSEKTLEELNKQVITNVLQYSTVTKKADGPQALSADITDSTTDPIEEMLKERKEVMLKMVKESPQEVTKYTLPQKLRDSLPEKLQPLVEKEVEVKGTLNYIHVHDFEKKTVTNIYTLTKPNNGETTYNVHFSDQASAQNTNSLSTKVAVEGISIDNELLVNELNIQGDKLLAAPTVSGPRNVLIVPVYFTDTTINPTFTKERIKTDFFDYVDKYYRELSYDKVWFDGNVTDWIQLPITRFSDISQLNVSITNFLVPKLINENKLDLDKDVTLVVLKEPGTGALGFASGLEIRLPTGQKKPLLISVGPYSAKSYINLHEIGHTLGAQHSNFLFCGRQVISPKCTFLEYGDPFDIMGSDGAQTHMNSVTKHVFGWLEPLDITRSGRYTIEPLTNNTHGIRSIRIPRGYNDFTFVKEDGTDGKIVDYIEDYLYLEYRQPIGLDTKLTDIKMNGIPNNIFSGLLMHSSTGRLWPTLLDGSPSESDTSTFSTRYSPIIPVGQFFIDPASGTKITVISKDTNGITLDIALGPITDFIPPVVSITSPVAEETVRGIINITANANDNSSGISRVDFYFRNNTQDSTKDTLIYSDRVAPYETTLDTSKIPSQGALWIYAKAYDKLGEPFNYPGNVKRSTEVKVQSLNPIPPEVKTTTPSQDSLVINPVTITADATDLDGISVIYFTVDDKPVTDFPSAPPYTIHLTLSEGKHKVFATAYDSLFNSAKSSTVEFTVVKTLPSNTPTPTPAPVCTACSADVSKDGRVSALDYSIMVTCYDKEPTGICVNADINHTGVVDIEDYVCVVDYFGQSCQR